MASDLTLTVLSKVVPSRKASEYRDGVSAGEYPVDFTVKVRGTVNVKEDATPKTPTASIPVKEVLGMFIARSGAHRDANIKILRECLTEMLNSNKDKKGGAKGSISPEFDSVWADTVEAFLSTLPKTRVRGEVEMDGVTVEITED